MKYQIIKKHITEKKGKKAISELIAYVLLISLAVAMSGVIYAWLKFYVQNPLPEENCPQVSLIIQEYKCTGGSLNLTVQNKGRFTVDGYYIKVNNGTRDYEVREIHYDWPYVPFKMEPGNSTLATFDISAFGPGKVKAVEIEAIKGFDKNDNPILCENSILRQDITCT